MNGISVKVLVVEPERMCREAMVRLLRSYSEVEVAGQASSLAEGARQARQVGNCHLVLGPEVDCHGVSDLGLLRTTRNTRLADLLQVLQVMPLEPLTPREAEVLRLTGQGRSAPQVAQSLQITLSTVKTHQRAVYRKLKVSDKTRAILKALQLGLIHEDEIRVED